ncbi:MAG: hypothetical protein IT542_06200 [Rubellimicrobium sp.]|nr:hypothetical protein [Rubellimicrobium sp.]
MDVFDEPPRPETMFRVRAPLHVSFADGTTIGIEDWSLRAVYSDQIGDRPLDGVMLTVPFHGVGVYFPIELERGEAADEYLFRNLRGRERETLALFYRNLLSGRMTATADMINALDTPVDLVPMEETPAERAAATVGRVPRSTRAVVSLLAYATVFALVAGYLGVTVWKRMTQVPALAAQVASPDAGAGVIAWLPPTAALSVWPGMVADIAYRAEGGSGGTIRGTVAAVALTGAGTDALIEVRIVAPDLPAIPGAPVGVIFLRGGTAAAAAGQE